MIINPTQEEQQELILDQGLKNIKAQSYQIKNTINTNNLRQCLKETNLMLCELRTSELTPKNYYQLYTTAFDEMQYVTNFFQEEVNRGRKLQDLYDSVQQAKYIIPRLYLMITAGVIYMENNKQSCRQIIFDLFSMIKGIQNPIRGLFIRYYLLKSIKDKLPDKGNEYETKNATFDDTLRFILLNLEDMNQLWIRLSSNTVGNEKLMRDKERNQLKILVGENITRLSSLNGLTLEIYKNRILPKIISILLDSKDNLSQQYLMECIIHAFPDDYNIDCMEIILETITKLNVGVDIKSLIIALMEKLAKYVGNNDNKKKENIEKEIEKIFNLLKNTFSKLIAEDEKLGIDIDIVKVLELQIAFMKFTVNCCPEKDKLQTINLILASGVKTLKIYDLKLTNNSIKLISKLLATSLECKEISIFQIENIFNLMNYLDFNSRSMFSLKIIESFIKNTTNDKIDSLEKIQKILTYMKPLIEDGPDSVEIDEFQFDIEQTIVSKLVFVIGSHSPEVIYDILVELKNVFINGGDKRKKYTFPSLANALLDLCYTISGAYDLQNNYLSDDVKTPIYLDKIQSLDISQINSSDIFYKTLMQIYTLFNEVVTEIKKLNPELAFKIYLNASIQVNSIHSNKNQFEEVCVSFINESISIFQEGKFESNSKYGLLTLLEGTLLNLNILSQENLLQFIQTLQNISQGLIKRNDQCNAMLNIAQLYYTLLGDKNKVIECLTKSKRFADFAITNPKMLILYVIILNKIIYFTEIDESEFIKTEFFEDIIETIKNHIQTISSENKETNDFLPSIQSYFDRTLDTIKTKKNEGKRKVYSEISNL